MYRIGDFSKLVKTTIKTLRYYDEMELLKPEFVDRETGYRFYTTDQLVKLHQIQSLRQIGLSIEEIKLILSGCNIENILKKRKSELETELAVRAEQLLRIEFILSGKEEENFMDYHAIVKELPSCIIYYKKLTVPNYDAYFEVIPAIGEAVKRANPDIKCMIPEYCFIEYLDAEYKEKDINVIYCEAVDKMGVETDGIKFKNLDAVTAVSVMHKGAYRNLSQAYAYAFKWIEENHYSIIGNPRESYIDGIWNKENEDDWLTELQIPVVHK